MTIYHRPAPGREPCTLPHHFSGRYVTWQRWNTDAGRMDTLHGIVARHLGDRRHITIERLDGSYVDMPCGSVVPWKGTR